MFGKGPWRGAYHDNDDRGPVCGASVVAKLRSIVLEVVNGWGISAETNLEVVGVMVVG